MRISRIKPLLSIRDSHPLLNKLFRRYNPFILSILMNIIVGISCLILLFVGAMGLYFFFKPLSNLRLQVISAGIVFLYAIFLTLRSAYSFLFSERERNMLIPLPITRSEIVFSTYLQFIKKTAFVTLYIVAITIYTLIDKNASGPSVIGNIALILASPLISVALSLLIVFLIHHFAHCAVTSKNSSKFEFKEKSSLRALVCYESKNFIMFASLKTELIMQFVFSLSLTCVALTSNILYLAFVTMYPSLNMVNPSSFSREGKFHKILQTLPIAPQNRIMPKVLFYFLIASPLLFACHVITYIISGEIVAILAIFPSVLYLLNISIIGIKSDELNPYTSWTNPNEAFRMNYLVFGGNILLGCITELLDFSHSLSITNNHYIGVLFASIINVVILSIFCLNIKAMRKNR